MASLYHKVHIAYIVYKLFSKYTVFATHHMHDKSGDDLTLAVWQNFVTIIKLNIGFDNKNVCIWYVAL